MAVSVPPLHYTLWYPFFLRIKTENRITTSAERLAHLLDIDLTMVYRRFQTIKDRNHVFGIRVDCDTELMELDNHERIRKGDQLTLENVLCTLCKVTGIMPIVCNCERCRYACSIYDTIIHTKNVFESLDVLLKGTFDLAICMLYSEHYEVCRQMGCHRRTGTGQIWWFETDIYKYIWQRIKPANTA